MLAIADIVLVNSNPLDAVAIVGLARATYRKMVQNLVWATGYNAFAIPLVARVLHSFECLLCYRFSPCFVNVVSTFSIALMMQARQ